MSEPRRVLLVGATGLVGRAIMEQAVDMPEVRLTALARREVKLPVGARMEMCLAEPSQWRGLVAGVRPDVLISALGTTWRKAGKDEITFSKVDHGLVLDCARAAKAAGTKHMVDVSAVGASEDSRSFYLRVKGKIEADLRAERFRRLDILRPALLRGSRTDDRRPLERVGQLLAPAIDWALHGRFKRYHSIKAVTLARASLNLSLQNSAGVRVYEYPRLIAWADGSDPVPRLT